MILGLNQHLFSFRGDAHPEFSLNYYSLNAEAMRANSFVANDFVFHSGLAWKTIFNSIQGIHVSLTTVGI